MNGIDRLLWFYRTKPEKLPQTIAVLVIFLSLLAVLKYQFLGAMYLFLQLSASLLAAVSLVGAYLVVQWSVTNARKEWHDDRDRSLLMLRIGLVGAVFGVVLFYFLGRLLEVGSGAFMIIDLPGN